MMSNQYQSSEANDKVPKIKHLIVIDRRQQSQLQQGTTTQSEIGQSQLQHQQLQIAQQLNEEPKGTATRQKAERISANFTDIQRNWIFGFLCMARGELGMPLDEINNAAYYRTREMIEEYPEPLGGRVPSIAMIKCLWQNFLETGQISKRRNGGRKKKVRQTDESNEANNSGEPNQ